MQTPHAGSPGASQTRTSSSARVARLARNSAANLLRLGASWLIVLLVPPALVHHLDKPSYSTWMLVLQVGAYASLFDGGLQISIGRFVARAEQQQDRTSLGQLLSSACALLCGGALLILVLVALGASHMARLFPSIPAGLQTQAALTLLLVGGSLGLAFPASVLAGLSLGREKNHVNAFAGAASRMLGAAGAVWAAVHHQGLVAMGAWTAAGTLAQPLLFLVAQRAEGLRTLLRPMLIRAAMVWEFTRFCAAMMASQLGMLLISGLDLPIVAAWDFRSVGYYALATTAANMLGVPYSAVLNTLVPSLSTMSGGEGPERMGQVLLRTTRLSTVLLAVLGVPLLTGMPVLLRLWVGSDYATHTLVLAELLVVAQLIRLSLAPYTLIAFSAGEQSRVLVSSVGEGIVNLALSLLFVRRLGAEGVALGTIAGAVAGIALHFFISMKKTQSMRIERARLLLQSILQPVAWASAPAAAVALLLPHLHPAPAQLALLALAALLLCTLFWFVSLGAADRQAMMTLAVRMHLPVRASRRVEV